MKIIASLLIIFTIALLAQANSTEEKLTALLATLSQNEENSSLESASTLAGKPIPTGEKKAFSHKSVSGHASKISKLLDDMEKKFQNDIKASKALLESNRLQRQKAAAEAKKIKDDDKKEYYTSRGNYNAIVTKNTEDEEKDVDRHEALKDQIAQELDLIQRMKELLGSKISAGGSGFHHSLIMNAKQRAFLRRHVESGMWKKCYTGSKDGFSASAFHTKCNNLGATVTIVRSDRKNIFGGFTSVPWNGKGLYKSDEKAFLFSLKGGSRSAQPYIVSKRTSAHAIYDNNGYGPTFGNGHDLYIANNMKSNSNYLNTAHAYNTKLSYELNGRTRNFRVDEIEVYYNAKKSRGFTGSKILNEKQKEQLKKWTPYGNYKLVYRGSRDGFSADAFHRKSNSLSSTVTVVKSNHNNVFGAFTTTPWKNYGNYRNTGWGFEYTFAKGQARKFDIRSNNYYTYDNAGYGPTFGNGHDLYINNNMRGANSYNNAPHAYATPGRGSLDGGNYNFRVAEIEVYADFKKTTGFTDSKLLTPEQAAELKGSLNGGKFELCYRASTNGYSAPTFHSRCNNKGRSVTVIRSNKGNVFGAYASGSWRSRGNYVQRENGWLYSMKRNNQVKFQRFSQRNKNNIMYDNNNYGPTFGGGHDLYVHSAMRNNHNYQGQSNYYCPNGYLNAQRNFYVSDLEVYVSST